MRKCHICLSNVVLDCSFFLLAYSFSLTTDSMNVSFFSFSGGLMTDSEITNDSVETVSNKDTTHLSQNTAKRTIMK